MSKSLKSISVVNGGIALRGSIPKFDNVFFAANSVRKVTHIGLRDMSRLRKNNTVASHCIILSKELCKICNRTMYCSDKGIDAVIATETIPEKARGD